MATGMAIAGGIKAVGAYRNKKASDAASREQEAISRENVKREREESAEALRRTGETFGRLESTTAARSSASGLGGSTRTRYQEAMKRSHQEELDWMKKSGASRASIMEREGKAQADITRKRGRADFISGLGSAFGTVAGSGIWK